MSAGLGQLNLDQPAWQVTPAPPVLPATGEERKDAAINAAMAPDRYDLIRESRAKRFDAMAKDYSDLTGDTLGPSPHNPSITMAERRATPNKPIEWYIAEREKSARAKLAAARQSFGNEQIPNDFLNYDSIDADIAQTGVQARERAAMLEGSGHGATAFFYGMGAAMTAPHNIVGMAFLGSTAVPREAATATLMQWTKSALAEGVYQGAIQTPLTVVGTGLEYSARSTIGTQPHIKEMIEEVATAAAGGFVLGAGTRALHGLLTKLKLAGIELPPDVRDAANVIEWDALYSGQNITDLHASRFEGLMDDAQASVMKGKAPEEPAHGPGEKLGPDIPATSPASAIEKADRLGLTEEIRSRVEAGETALQIEMGLDQKMTSSEIRVVRDSLGLSPRSIVAEPTKFLLAESERLQKYVDNPEGTPPIIELPKEGAGRPPETIITPEEVAMVDRAKTIAEASTDHADSLRALKAHDVEQAKIEAMAKRCGIGIP